MEQSGLFGIFHSNRSSNDHWGKNCFNSSFPTAMACYMLAQNIPAIYLHLNNKLEVVADTLPVSQVFNCDGRALKELSFQFESVFEPYQQYSFDTIDGIDLVVKGTDGSFLAPVEIKLTVVPDNSTFSKPERLWGAEMVIRSATTSYCALGMFDSVKGDARNIREIFESSCSDIQMWDNDYEMTHKLPNLSAAIDTFERAYLQNQKPLLMQTLWKTQGKSPVLADQAFDIVVWSDYAFSRLFVDSSYKVEKTMSRPSRSTARLARCLWELSKSGKIRISDIYRQMAFGNQTDKEFSVNGLHWRKYVNHERIVRPALPKTVISEIIQDGFIEKLSPERRFDQTLYFTVRN